MEKVFLVFSVEVTLAADKKSPAECIEQVAAALEDCHVCECGRGYKGKFVRAYGNLESALNEVNDSNAWSFRRASEGLKGDQGGISHVFYVREIELIDK